jgi:hypothetical protein
VQSAFKTKKQRVTNLQSFPPLQAPETYNLTQVLQQVKKQHESNPSD